MEQIGPETPQTLLLGHSAENRDQPEVFSLAMANRHGLITGATGSGKTVTVQGLAESLSAAGVGVFLADVKGDLSGLAVPRNGDDDTRPQVVFHDILGHRGRPLRISLAEMGPMLLAQLLGLTEAQEGALNIAYRLAREAGLRIETLADLRAWLMQIEQRHDEIKERLGAVPAATLNAIRRRLLVLEEEGCTAHFGAPGFDIRSLLGTGNAGPAPIHILAAEELYQHPRTYAFTLMWLLSALARELDEIGDRDRPRLVFFFDEAHLLFRNAPPVLMDEIERVTRLIRSKGVGVFFATQHPHDIPPRILAQLSHKIVHSLRSFTPQDRQIIRAIAGGMPAEAGFDVARAIAELGIGEAIVSMLGADGRPEPARTVFMRTPDTRLGPISEAERSQIIGPVRPAFHQADNVIAFPGGRSVPASPTIRPGPDPALLPERRGLAYNLAYAVGRASACRARNILATLRGPRR